MATFSYDLTAPLFTEPNNVLRSSREAKVSQHVIRNAQRYGMNDYEFDKICVGLGFHPAEIADQWIETGVNAVIPRSKR